MCSAKFFKNLAVDSANLSESWVNWIRVISFQLFRFVCLLNSGAPRSTDHSAEQILSSREKHISPDDSGYQMIMTTLWNDVKCIQFPIQYLVGGLEHFLFFHILGIIWNVIIPTDELIFFSWVGIPPTRYILMPSSIQVTKSSQKPKLPLFAGSSHW